LKGDKVFYEDPKMNISKWFKGFDCLRKLVNIFRQTDEAAYNKGFAIGC
jgi:hypothetical protein